MYHRLHHSSGSNTSVELHFSNQLGHQIWHLKFLECYIFCLTNNWTSNWWVIDPYIQQSSEEGHCSSSEFFGFDLQWKGQAFGKCLTDCKILLLLLQGITWTGLRAMWKALNASTLLRCHFSQEQSCLSNCRGKVSNMEIWRLSYGCINQKSHTQQMLFKNCYKTKHNESYFVTTTYLPILC